MLLLSFSSSSSFGATVTTGMSLVDQGQRAVLELAGRVGFGVDVADFLELERPFQRDRVVQAAAQEQRVVLLGEAARPSWTSCGSSASTGLQAPPAGGAWPSRWSASCAALERPLAWPAPGSAGTAPASWVVKALVEATPISAPARVM